MIKRRPPRLEQIFRTYAPPMFLSSRSAQIRQTIGDLEAVHHAFETYVCRARDEFCVAVGRYLIMPDHTHFFVRGGDDFKLTQWVNGLKRAISVALGATKKRPLWQLGFFDHVLRTRVTARNGRTCARILCGPDWLLELMTGGTKVNLL